MRRRRWAHPLAIHAANPVDHKVRIASVSISMDKNGSVLIVMVLRLAVRIKGLRSSAIIQQQADKLDITSKERGRVV